MASKESTTETLVTRYFRAGNSANQQYSLANIIFREISPCLAPAQIMEYMKEYHQSYLDSRLWTQQKITN